MADTSAKGKSKPKQSSEQAKASPTVSDPKKLKSPAQHSDPKSPNSKASKKGEPSVQKAAATATPTATNLEAKAAKTVAAASSAKSDPKAAQKAATAIDFKDSKLGPKAKPDPKSQNVATGATKEEEKAKSKSKLDSKVKEKEAAVGTGKKRKLEDPTEEEAVQQDETTSEAKEDGETVPYVNPFKIHNVYAHYLERHPPPKPWSFDMSPPRRPGDKPVLDPFKWSKDFVHPWGEVKTKDPETIAEEERLAKLEADRLAKTYIRPCLPEEHTHKRVSIYCQPQREPIYKLDIYSNPVLNEAGNPVYQPIYMLNSLGNMLLDGAGNPIPVYLMDEDGNVRLDGEDNPIPGPTYTLDPKGNPLLDEAGNLIPEHQDLPPVDEKGNVLLDEHGHPRHQQPRPKYMLNEMGRVMLDHEGNRILARPLTDAEGEVVLNEKGEPVLGRFQYGKLDEEEGQLVLCRPEDGGELLLDAEGAPILERQETIEEKKSRLALEAAARKAKALQDKVEKERIVMHTPLPKKPVPWREYCSTMYLPRSLKTAVYKDRGVPGDDWRYFVKKYTIAEMNHRMAVQLHGKTAVLWRKLHEHETYLQNPRYAAEIKQIKALRIFRMRETEEGQEYDLIDPHVLYFDGFEPGKTYVQHLRIYNVSPWTQRLRVVKPGTPEFFMTSNEESFQGKNLVSGNKCDFDVIFQPSTICESEDVVTIKTEMQTLPLKLKAIHPYPMVALPTFVDMGLCLSGHAICYHYSLTSRGAGAAFSFVEYRTNLDLHTVIEDPRYDDLKQTYLDSNILYIPPFIAYPRTFDTTTDSEQEFIFLFRPPRAGVYTYIVQLTTTTALHWEIKFQGTAVDLKLDLQKADGKDFNPGQAALGFSFGDVTVSHYKVKVLTLRSHTPVSLKFYWRIQDRHVQLDKEEDPEGDSKPREVPIVNLKEFVADPESGAVAANGDADVRFKFTPSDLENYRRVAALYVDTRYNFPLSSDVWRDFREALRWVEYKKANQLASENWSQRVLWGIDRSGFQCSDQRLVQSSLQEIVANVDKIFHVTQIENSGTIFRIAELGLHGSGTHFDVEICPKLYLFSGMLTLGEVHLGTVEIVNDSPTEVIFTWDRPKTPYGVVKNGTYVLPLSGRIGAESRQTIQLTTRARKVGRIDLELHCLVESPFHKGQLPLSLKVQGHVVGPNVNLFPPILDFGLCQIDSTYSLEITLTNTSQYAHAPFKIFSSRDAQLPASSPFVPESQLNPFSPNTTVPFGSGLFDGELQRKPDEPPSRPPPLVTLLPGYSHDRQLPTLETAAAPPLSAPPLTLATASMHMTSTDQAKLPVIIAGEARQEESSSTTTSKNGPKAPTSSNAKQRDGRIKPKSDSKEGKKSSKSSKSSKSPHHREVELPAPSMEEEEKELHDPSSQPPPPSSGLPQVHASSHAQCGPYYKAPAIVPYVNPLDRDVSPEYVPAPQKRAWISRAFGETMQVFNDGITDPKLPPTTLFQPRDPFGLVRTSQPLHIGQQPPKVQPPLLPSGVMVGITDLAQRNRIKHPMTGDDGQPPLPGQNPGAAPSPAPASAPTPAPADVASEIQQETTTPWDEAEIHGKGLLSPSSLTPARRASYVDMSFSHLKGLPAQTQTGSLPLSGSSEQKASTSPSQEISKDKLFLEQMGTLGALAKIYDSPSGPSGPPILKTPPDKPVYEEDLRQELVFEPEEGIVPKGNKSVTVKVSLTGTICGFMRLAIVCEISKGKSPTQYAIARAHIDAPEACIIPSFIDLRTKFINIPITIKVVIRNLKALPACFNWPYRDRVGSSDVEDLDVEVIKQRGELPPRLEWGLTINLIPRKLGPLDTILICNVFKMINPLGLKLKAIIVDARISYHVFRPDVEDGHQKSGRTVAHERILLRRQQEALGNPVEEEDADNWVDPPVPCLDFGRRRELGRAHCLKLLLCNHSPIEVKVQLTVARYVTEPLASLLKDECWVISSLTERLSYLIPNRRDPFQKAFKGKGRDLSSEFQLNSPALTDLSDVHLKYFSKPGKQRLWRRAEGAMHEALIKEGMPLAFLCYPSYTGVIKPWGDWSVEVVCFSNLPGNYIDVLTSKVGRLDPMYLPMEVEIIGTPLVARRNWLEPTGLQQPDDEGEITLAWQPVPAGHHLITRQFWVRNNSPFHMEVKWEFKRQATIEGGKFVGMNFVIEEDLLTHAIALERPEWYADDPMAQVVIKEHIGIVYDQQVHCVFRDYLETIPQHASSSDIVPFEIIPRQQVILGHSSYPFEVQFFPNHAESYSFILAGYQRVYDGTSSERRRSTQFVFDSTFDRKDDQYVYRRPEKKHVCEHVVSFYSKIKDSIVHTLAHKTSIVDPPDPEVLALQLTEDGKKPKRLSRFHCTEDSNSSSSGHSSDGDEERKKFSSPLVVKPDDKGGVTTSSSTSNNKKKEMSLAKVVKFLNEYNDPTSDLEDTGESLAMLSPLGTHDYSGGFRSKNRERAYSKVHDIAYQSESEDEEPKYQFDIRRRSSRQRRVSTGRAVNFDEQAQDDGEADTYDPPEEKDWTTVPEATAIDLSEPLATDHCKNLYAFEAIRPLRVKLDAVVILPRLQTSLDDLLLERVSFQCFGNDPPEKRFDIQPLYLTNIYGHSITFNLYVPEAFDVLSIRRGVLQPVEHGDRCQRMSIFEPLNYHFILEAGHSLQFNLSYRPVVDEFLLEPPDVITDCSIRVEFFGSQYEQFIPLHADLLFPELRLMADTVSLGDCVTATCTRATDFSLSNPSLPDAEWRIVTQESHEQTVALASKGIPPHWEDSRGLEKMWPVIWSTNPERGVVRGRRQNELGPRNEVQYYRNRNIVTVSFAPFEIMDYELTFWVEVRLGRGVRLTLTGTGIDEPPQPLPPLKSDQEEGKKKGGKDTKKGKDNTKGKKKK